jgi:hypothetical protein
MARPRKIRVKPAKPKRGYDPKYCRMIVEYFDQPNYEETPVKITMKSGAVIEKKERKPAPPRHLTKFARTIGFNIDTLEVWAKKYPEFGQAWLAAKEMQKEQCNECATMGLWNANYSMFYACNVTDMRDRRNVDMTSGGRALAPTVVIKAAVVPGERKDEKPG